MLSNEFSTPAAYSRHDIEAAGVDDAVVDEDGIDDVGESNKCEEADEYTLMLTALSMRCFNL